ncbi:hypothetical protein MHYP_G00090370 [Metynnis hypsauchen]
MCYKCYRVTFPSHIKLPFGTRLYKIHDRVATVLLEGQATEGQILHGAPDSLFRPTVILPREKAVLSAQWPPRLIASVSHRPGAGMEITAAVIGRRRTRNTLHSADLSYGTDRSHPMRPERKELTETEISRFSG